MIDQKAGAAGIPGSVWTRTGKNKTEVAELMLSHEEGNVIKRVILRRIHHNTTAPTISIRLERKAKPKKDGTPRVDAEKDCSLYISEVESPRFLEFLQEAEVLRLRGIEEAFTSASLEEIWGALLNKASQSDLEALEEVLREGPDIPDVIGIALEHLRREKEITRLRRLIENSAVERDFQSWFEANPWVFQADAVSCLDDRRIDVQNIADLLFESVDGCIDLVELKRPGAKFWRFDDNHNNWVPHSELTGALTQVWNYQKELEKEMDSIETTRRLQGARILRPHATLIHGRSEDWDEGQLVAQRLLNSSLHSVTVITFDQALARAMRINALQPESDANDRQVDDQSIPPDEEFDPFAE